NPGDHTGNFTATVDWGDNTAIDSSSAANPVVSIVYTGDVNGLATYAVHASHTFAEETAAGSPNAVKVTVTDVGGSTGSPTLHAAVADAAVTVTAGADISAVEGAATGDTVVATFTDANPGNHTSD